MSLIFPSVVESISTRSDGSLKVILGTQEANDETGAGLIRMRGKYVKVLLSDENIIPDVVSAVEGASIIAGNQKTPSQKLRHVIYRLWQQEGRDGETSEDFYRNKITEIIEEIKLKLDH